MSDITLNLNLDTQQPLDEGRLNQAFAEAMSDKFDKFKYQGGNPQQFTCQVKTKMFNPIVSLKGSLHKQTSGNKTKVMVSATVTTNAWFWFTVLISLFFWPLFIVDFVMYTNQKKASHESLQHALNQLEFYLGDLSSSEEGQGGGVTASSITPVT